MAVSDEGCLSLVTAQVRRGGKTRYYITSGYKVLNPTQVDLSLYLPYQGIVMAYAPAAATIRWIGRDGSVVDQARTDSGWVTEVGPSQASPRTPEPPPSSPDGSLLAFDKAGKQTGSVEVSNGTVSGAALRCSNAGLLPPTGVDGLVVPAS